MLYYIQKRGKRPKKIEKIMQIVKYVNPKTKKSEQFVCFSDEERSAFNLIVSVLKELERHIFEGRDIYEFRFAQKFLKMVVGMTNLDDVTDEIDKIIMSECEGSEFQPENVGGLADLIDAIDSIAEIIDSASRSVEDGQKKKKNSKKTEKHQEKQEKYEQLTMDIAEDKEK